jgi:DNA-directed RNA polymerase beta' subunit
MKAERINLETEFLTDMATHNGFRIEKEDHYAPTNVDALVDSSKFTDCEYRCDCGAFIGQDLIGQVCPRCKSEISLHSLNFAYTGWIDLKGHKVISPVYYIILKRVLGTNVLRMILGDYKCKQNIKYNENDKGIEEEKKQKRAGRVSQDDIRYILKKVPKTKHCYQGIGHDQFYERFEEIIAACAPKNNPEVDILLKNKEAVFTSYIPLYSTAFRPVSKTSETKFYPKINKWFAMMVSVACRMENMVLDIEKIQALNYIQKCWLDAVEHVIKNEMSKKEGFVRSEIVGGSFTFSGRAVITLDISLDVDEVDLPYSMVITAYQYRLTYMLATRYNMTLEQAYLFVNTYEKNDIIISLLDEIMAEGQWVMYLREPTNNLASIVLAKIRRYKIGDDTMSVPLEVLQALNADFDGDALDILFLLDKNLVERFGAFHYSCLSDRVNETVKLDLLAWSAVAMGRMTE